MAEVTDPTPAQVEFIKTLERARLTLDEKFPDSPEASMVRVKLTEAISWLALTPAYEEST